jgi:hypothetical protein
MPSSAKGWIILGIFAILVWFVYSRFVAGKLIK